MNALAPTRHAPPVADTAPARLLLRLDGFEGPLDLLLELARAQKIDLGPISILALAEQYLAVIEGARTIRLELAADWLVMAAWLAWLKSRLLLPQEETGEDAETDAAHFGERLADLERIRALARRLDAGPVLGRDVFRRGAAEDLTVIDRSRLRLDLASLLSATISAARRAGAKRRFSPVRHDFWTVADALRRLEHMLGFSPSWTDLSSLLPATDAADEALPRAAAVASLLLAGLELAKQGGCELRQDDAFAPVLLRRIVAA